MHELSSFVIDGTNVDKNNGGVFNLLQFVCDGGNVDKYNNPAYATDYTPEQSVLLTKTKEIRLYNGTLEGVFTINSITLNFNSTHATPSNPTLNNGTTSDMTIFEGESLTLSATNGYWREFTDKTYTTEKKYENGSPIPNERWDPSAPFDGTTLSKLGLGDHYFGIQDATTCTTFDVRHSSELVKVHVAVKEPIYSIDVNGTTRQYDVYAPNGITGTVGVVVSLHGANCDYYTGRVDFNSIADNNKNDENKRFVVVYPRGLNHTEIWNGARCWETYNESSTDDTEFFKAIVNSLNTTFKGQFSIDYSRIYLAGFSNGGMMAYKAAHKDGDFYAACASVAGFPVNESHLWHAGSKPVPFLHIHGANDNVVTISSSISSTTYDINTIVHNMVYRNGAAFYPTSDDGMVTDNSNVTKDCHNAETGGAAYYYYKIAGMYHEYSHDWNSDGKDDIAATMWAFFNKTDKVNNVDNTLKFRINDATNFWSNASSCGFDNVNTGTSVLSYGGSTKTDNNKNVYHSLQFDGGINGAPHYLKLNVQTTVATTTEYYLVTLTKTGSSTPVFAKRYQAGKGSEALYINFAVDPGINEYKLAITKSSSTLDVKVNTIEFHTGKCQDANQTESATYFYDVATILSGMNPIYQPVYGQSFDGIAKEYLPIADIPVGSSNTISDNLKVDGTSITSLPSTLVSSWTEGKATIKGKTLFSLAKSKKSGENQTIKSKNAFILCGDEETYTIDQTKGINISQHGRAMMPEYLNGTQGSFPTHGVIAIKLQGTLDFTLLTSSKYDTDANRRTLKIYYTNDQLDGELKELKECWFYGTRCEGYNNDLAPLSASIRLPQLGKDGTCTVFVTYEGDGKGSSFTHDDSKDNDEIWIKGFVIKRPDLKVTIGRTDSKYSGQTFGGENNTTCTHFGEGKPYIWSFENVGFNNTKNADLNSVKVNQQDGRTYICGVTDKDVDHLLVYSDIASKDENDKVHFNGITTGQEYIEFRNASQYAIMNDRRNFTPITSNGLKVNVTGSGWFKIKCSAPNGPVKMRVFSSTNYGTSYINLLREFTVEKTSSATDWKEYTVYLKGHVERKCDNQKGFWDGEIQGDGNTKNAEEILRMSLYVVFDKISDTTYDESHPQLNIHQLSWLNEEPADYVFQREENPELLTEWQTIKRNKETVLYWMAGTKLKEKKDDATIDTYDSYDQFTRTTGSKSPDGYASISVPSDAGTYNAYWDIAAPAATNAHTEKAYANQGYVFTSENEYINVANNGNTEFDMPISGSFIRICAMKNAYVIAHVLPGAAGGAVYVLDESGSPIPYKANGSNLDVDANKRGYVSTLQNFDGQEAGGAKSMDATMRIDFTANAGKEYFICAKGASISLARLEVQEDRYAPTKSSTTLELTDGADNSSAITSAINTKEYYRDAKLTRTLAAGKWASIVLPFSMNEKKFQEVFGEDAKCVHFTEVNTTTNTVNLTHHFYNMIVAGRPVFIRPSKDVTNPEITDITLQADDVKTTTTTNGFEFFASYNNETMNKNDLYLNNNNAIKYLNVASATYPGMRSFIKSPSGYDPSKGGTGSGTKALFLDFDGEETSIPTGIEECIAGEFGEDVVVVTKSTNVYDLNGRIVANGADINRLPAGMYIVNGKKYFVK